MSEKPSTLFLIVFSTLGSIVFSAFALNGNPVVLFVIPVAVLAALLYDEQTGLLVGITGAVLAGIVLYSIAKWEIAALAIAAGAAGYLAGRISKQKTPLELVFYTVIGTLIFEVLHGVNTGRTILFRPEMILGSTPETGARLLAGIIIAFALAAYWLPEKAKK